MLIANEPKKAGKWHYRVKSWVMFNKGQFTRICQLRLGPHYRLFIGRQFSWFLISMRTYVSAHTKAIVVGRQIDRKIVARSSRFPFNKKVGQQLTEHGVQCECAHSPTIQSVIHTYGVIINVCNN
jgi:hypothetical protein